MAQVTDRTVGANPTGFDMRTELNSIISALETDNSGSSEPLNTVAGMKWMDTSNATYYYVKERNHDNTAWVTLFRYTVASKIMEAVSNNVVLSQTNIANEIHVSTSKATPIDADEIGLIDSAATFGLKKLTWLNLKATLKTYFDTLYVALSGNQTVSDVKTFSSSPIVPTPTTDMQAATKLYVDTNGFVVASTAEAQAGTNNTNAITPLRLREGLNATGTAPIYACRAWVNFNGTGTVAIRASGNVSSITDNGVGDYTANFTTAMVDANYGVSGTASDGTNAVVYPTSIRPGTYSVGSLRFASNANVGATSTLSDTAFTTVEIFR